jgi:hypothetical protein
MMGYVFLCGCPPLAHGPCGAVGKRARCVEYGGIYVGDNIHIEDRTNEAVCARCVLRYEDRIYDEGVLAEKRLIELYPDPGKVYYDAGRNNVGEQNV